MPPKKNSVQSRMQALEQRLAALTVQPRARKNRPRRRRRQAQPAIRMDAGEVMISKMELLGTMTVAASKPGSSGSASLQSDDLPFLKALSKSFERIRWLSAKVYYRPAASMTTPGLVSYGVDWNWATPATTRAQISSYSPNSSNAVWKESSIVLPPARLQSRLWYSTQTKDTVDSGPGVIAWAVDSAGGTAGLTVGELWVEYRVQLSGTRF